MVGRKLIERRPDDLLQLVLLGDKLGRASRRVAQALGQHMKRLAAETAATGLVVRKIGGDAVEPWQQRQRAVELPGVGVQAIEGILQDLLGGLGVARDPQRKLKDLALVAIE